jgi:hypothetical protein
MYKVYSGCLLFATFAFTTLVFTSAHAPTFQVWRNLATASADTHSAPVTSYLDSHKSFLAMDAFTATREYAEESDLNRFGVDEFYLPKLDVDLPELFNWSEGERKYLASNTLPMSFGQSLDHAMSIALRGGGVNIGYSRGSALGSAHGAADASSVSQTQNAANLSSKGASTSPSNESAPSSNSDSSSNENADNEGNAEDTAPEQLANNEANDEATNTPGNTPGSDIFAPIDPASLPPTTDTAPGYTIVDEQKPVQVPAPGAFGLFVLGLAGLRLVGRKKNGSG